MRKITKLLPALAYCSLIIFASCKNDDGGTEVDPRDAQGDKLAGTWSVTSAKFDGMSREDWEGAEITFNYDEETDEGTYTVTGVPDEGDGVNTVFGAEGVSVTWAFSGKNDLQTVERSDGILMTVIVTEGTSLTLSFQTGAEDARVAGFEGLWEFEFEPAS